MTRIPLTIVLLTVLVLACGQGKKYHHTAHSTPYATSPLLQEITAFQEALNVSFANPETSPLPDQYRKDFEGLDFFAPDTSYVVQAQLKRTPNPTPLLLPTTTDNKMQVMLYGVAHFTLNAKEHQLNIYQRIAPTFQVQHEEMLFLPFLDNTNGTETYGGGRYIDLTLPQSDTLVIDFNKAYAPYCAYSTKYSCPLVPRHNYLRTKVRAGVKVFNKL